MSKIPELVASKISSKLIQDLNNIKDPVIKYSLFFNLIKTILMGVVDAANESTIEAIEDKKFELEDVDNEENPKRKAREIQRDMIRLEKTKDNINNLSKTL